MTLEELISAAERLQALYPQITKEQNEAEQKIFTEIDLTVNEVEFLE